MNLYELFNTARKQDPWIYIGAGIGLAILSAYTPAFLGLFFELTAAISILVGGILLGFKPKKGKAK